MVRLWWLAVRATRQPANLLFQSKEMLGLFEKWFFFQLWRMHWRHQTGPVKKKHGSRVVSRSWIARERMHIYFSFPLECQEGTIPSFPYSPPSKGKLLEGQMTYKKFPFPLGFVPLTPHAQRLQGKRGSRDAPTEGSFVKQSCRPGSHLGSIIHILHSNSPTTDSSITSGSFICPSPFFFLF